MKLELRKFTKFVDKTFIEGGKEAKEPVVLVSVAAVFKNPWAGQGFVEDLKPVILDLTLELIDNMLIVNPPKEDERFVEETQQTAQASYLDFDDLDIDYLNEDFLEANELEFTELDINFLDVNFLEDLLNVLDALAVGEEEDQLAEATGLNITVTLLGKDPDTQITTLVTGQVISLRRSVSESVRLDIDGTGSYTIILIQDGVSNLVKINGGSDTTITIKQSS